MRSTIGGASWQQQTHLATDTTQQNQPVVAAAGANVHVCWWDGRDDGNGVRHRGSTDNGVTWGLEHCLTEPGYSYDYPSVAAAGGNVYVSFRICPGGQLAFGYCGQADNGQTWSAETTLTTISGTGTSTIGASGPRAHLVFYDDREGNAELYHKRNLTAGGVEEAAHGGQETTDSKTTIVREVLFLAEATVLRPQEPNWLFDAAGRRVMGLHPGLNNVSRLAPGVYFARTEGSETRNGTGARAFRIVVTR